MDWLLRHICIGVVSWHLLRVFIHGCIREDCVKEEVLERYYRL